MIKMPKALLSAWLADLRSGPPQAKHYLHGCYGYCCLGRLQIAAGDADVEKDENGISLQVPSKWWLEAHGVDFGNDAGNPNVIVYEDVLDKIGIERSLAGINDEGISFAVIADIIEANAEGV